MSSVQLWGPLEGFMVPWIPFLDQPPPQMPAPASSGLKPPLWSLSQPFILFLLFPPPSAPFSWSLKECHEQVYYSPQVTVLISLHRALYKDKRTHQPVGPGDDLRARSLYLIPKISIGLSWATMGNCQCNRVLGELPMHCMGFATIQKL